MSDEQLAAAAKALSVPEPLVKRSAEARAKAEGIPVEQVLAAWAGGGGLPAAAATAEEPATAEPETPALETADGGRETAEVPEEIAEEAAPPAQPAPAPVPAVVAPVPSTPERVAAAEAARYPEVVTVATAGLTERTGSGVPGWLTGLFVMVPLVALFYLISNSAGVECGRGGALAVDPMTGDVVNCDGTPFEGSGGGGGGSNFLAIGEAEFTSCAACHGTQGEGGVGPAFAGGAVLTTFGSCADHVQWVLLGSAGWQAEVGDTYGDTDKPVNGGMPGHSQLSDEQLRSVVLFERVRFGGANPEEATVDCGLAAPEEGGEEGGGEPATATTLAEATP